MLCNYQEESEPEKAMLNRKMEMKSSEVANKYTSRFYSHVLRVTHRQIIRRRHRTFSLTLELVFLLE